MAHPAFECLGCRMPTDDRDEYYMLKDEIWALTNIDKQGGMLCVGCVEKKIGRKLTSEDFSDVPLNKLDYKFSGKSSRLIARLTDNPGHP